MLRHPIARLSPNLRVLAWRLLEGRVVSKDELIEALYGNCADGGPDDADNCIRVSMSILRLALAPSGVEIGTCWGGGWYLKTDLAVVRALLADEIDRNVRQRPCRIPRGKRQRWYVALSAA